MHTCPIWSGNVEIFSHKVEKYICHSGEGTCRYELDDRKRNILLPMYITTHSLRVCRYPDQSQGYAGTLTNVRGMQIPRPVSRLCRYPDQCRGYAGMGLLSQPFPGGIIRRLPLAPAYPIEKLTTGSKTDEGIQTEH